VSPILSRCIGFHFRALDLKSASGILKDIISKENIKINTNAITELYNMCNGDMRLSINLLQKISYNNIKKIDVEDVRESYGLLKSNYLDKIVKVLSDKNINSNILLIVTNSLLNKGYSVKLILESFADYFKKNKILNEENMCKFYFKLSNIDNFSNLSGNLLIATLSILNYLSILLINN